MVERLVGKLLNLVYDALFNFMDLIHGFMARNAKRITSLKIRQINQDISHICLGKPNRDFYPFGDRYPFLIRNITMQKIDSTSMEIEYLLHELATSTNDLQAYQLQLSIDDVAQVEFSLYKLESLISFVRNSRNLPKLAAV